jgi:hypothetical protein
VWSSSFPARPFVLSIHPLDVLCRKPDWSYLSATNSAERVRILKPPPTVSTNRGAAQTDIKCRRSKAWLQAFWSLLVANLLPAFMQGGARPSYTLQPRIKYFFRFVCLAMPQPTSCGLETSRQPTAWTGRDWLNLSRKPTNLNSKHCHPTTDSLYVQPTQGPPSHITNPHRVQRHLQPATGHPRAKLPWETI